MLKKISAGTVVLALTVVGGLLAQTYERPWLLGAISGLFLGLLGYVSLVEQAEDRDGPKWPGSY